MRHRLSTTGTVTPQPPGRTPHRSALRLPGGETLLVPGASPRTPVPPAPRFRAPPARPSALLSGAPRARRPAREAMKTDAFEFATAGRVLFGAGRSAELPALLAGYGQRALVCTGASPGRHAGLLAGLGLPAAVFPVAGEPTVD